MKKVFASLILCLAIFLKSPKASSASLITIRNDGEIIWNVLSQESSLNLSRYSYIQVKKVTQGEGRESPIVDLEKKDGKISLVVSSEGQLREFDIVSTQPQSLIEIEERPEVQKIVIGIKEGKFSLEQEGVVALTDHPIHIDAKRAIFSITTSKGEEFLYILPKEAAETALRTRLLNKLSVNQIEISEFEQGLQYKISGERVFNFFDIFNYSIPVSVFISTSTGEVLSIDSPTWFRFLKFLFI